MSNISFNKPYLTGKEIHYIYEAVHSGKISGNGAFTKKCQQFIEKHSSSSKCLLSTSCTDALEMSAILANIKPGDEVIMPSYTFVSTANAFILRGAKIIFTDSRPDHPGMDESSIRELITDRTKAIVPVHYAGVACDMNSIMDISDEFGLFIIEDAAQAIDSSYKWPNGTISPLGSLGHFGTYSFHETKNIQSGEGGALLINDASQHDRAEVIWEKGTNRTAFWRGDVDKYGWVDIGSSFLPSELIAAFLYAQLENLDEIQSLRKAIWTRYADGLKPLIEKGSVREPYIPSYATNNAHMYYLVCNSLEERTGLIAFLTDHNIYAAFHYQSLHNSEYFEKLHDGRELIWADRYTSCLVRLPIYAELSLKQVDFIIEKVLEFYN
ncbi:MAG: dTDP-4-amino-4,6-dideoxygalactose transaminase [Flavobacteriales bacterium]|nr:dTDP-4-amino-4,6-dideoxygalactose transaminase [Flavobacteriales bacterium]